MKQLSLFSPQELFKCYEATNVINKIRNSLYMPLDFRSRLYPAPKGTLGQVIKFPKVKVS